LQPQRAEWNQDAPSKKPLNRENLEALGAQRLAELLIELGTGNAAVKRRLRLELASTQSPGEVAKEIRKRLTSNARSGTLIDWQNRKPFVEELESQRRAIVTQIANLRFEKFFDYGDGRRRNAACGV
jgi:hypothetical protein